MKKINIHIFIYYLIILFPFTTIIQNVPFLQGINKIMMFLLLSSLSIVVLFNKIKKINILVLFLTIFLYILAFLFTKNHVEINVFFYFILWIIYFLYLDKNYLKIMEIFNGKVRQIKNFLIVWNFVVFISLFFKSSYINGYFSPFGCGEHRFGSSCILITALNYLVIKKSNRKSYFYLSVLPFIGVCLGGARTYLVIYIILIISLIYLNCKKKINFYISIIPICLIIFLLIYFSPIATKIDNTYSNGYYGFLATLTSGRSMFWVYDMKEFFNLNIFQQFVGNGFDFIYITNLKYINREIWAHNDFINILMNFGYLGLCAYLYVFLKFCKANIPKKGIKKIQKFSFYFIWFFNAFFNMVYTYPLATLSLPFILYTLCNNKFNKK